MKKCLLLILTVVLVLLLPSCVTAAADGNVQGIGCLYPNDDVETPPTLTVYEKAALEEREKIEAVVAEHIGADSFTLKYVAVGYACNCTEHEKALKIGGTARIGNSEFEWSRYLFIAPSLTEYVYDEKLINMEEKDIRYRYMPGTAKLVEQYLKYGEDWRWWD